MPEVLQTVAVIILVSLAALGLEARRRKKSSPTRPWITCFLDSLFCIPFALRLGPWGKPNTIEQALIDAKKQTGLTDIGETVKPGSKPAFIERYELARKYGIARSKAEYTPFGYMICATSLTKRMVAKLQLVDYVKKHPSIEKVPIVHPIFVIGFPRTGTTFLHELLGLHPQVKMHYSWEQMDPVPKTDDESLAAQAADRAARYKNSKSYFHTTMLLAGDAIQRIHRIGYDEPEECTTPCSMELPYGVSELPWIPFAAKEVIPTGAGRTFAVYRKFLQLMMWQSEHRDDPNRPTWMLKCPFHLPYLTELVNEFPDATVVWTHRNPVECIASACSLYETLLHMATEEPSVDRKALGQAVLEYTRISLDKAAETFRLFGDKLKPVHVRYADNVRNPKSICKTIMEQSGLEFSAEYESRMDAYLAKSAADRAKLKADKSVANKAGHGSGDQLHEYSLSDYGLSEEQVRREFADYIAEYSLDAGDKKKK